MVLSANTPGIEMYGGNMGGMHMGYHGNARGPEIGVRLAVGQLGSEAFFQHTVHHGDVHPHFFKDPAAHDGHGSQEDGVYCHDFGPHTTKPGWTSS